MGYAFGVDLRRAAWLAGSTLGDPLMRAVDRRWSRLVQTLEEGSLRPLRKAPPLPLLEELAQLITMLRAPLPTVRLLRPEVASSWPMVTPLGTTKGAIHWLVLDAERLMALPADQRTFVLASALGHLQCEHGPIFAAHLMAHLFGGLRTVRTLMRPWAKVAVFSADRAGMLAVQSLEASLQAVQALDLEKVPWLPRWPRLDARRQSLEDFDHSQMMVRRRVLSDPEGGGWTLSPPDRPTEDRSALARRIRGVMDRMGGVKDKLEGFEPTPRERAARAEAEAHAKARAESEGQEQGPEQAPADSAAEGAEAPTASTHDGGGSAPRTPAAGPPEPAPLDEERMSRLRSALGDAWSLARCDARLTRRLRIL